MNFENFLNKKKYEQQKENVNNLLTNLDFYNDKIDKYVSANSDLGFTAEEVKNEIKNNNPYAIAAIRKSPGRQNISEKCFFEYLNIDKASASGKKSIRFDKNGELTDKKSFSTKSADFILDDKNGNIVYGTQKYLKDGGGAQDNQIEDAKLFADYGSKNNKIIIAVDGDYGTSVLKNIQFNNNVEVLTTDEIKVKLDNGELKKHTAFYD